jgi:tRNA modification GTPase
VVRLSGTDSRRIAASLFRTVPAWESWRARTAELIDRDGNAVDHVVVTFFQAPRSYTAEDLVEISCH